MIWFAWRQFRTQTWITIGALVAIGAVLIVTGRSVADAYADSGLAACGGDCATAIDTFLDRARTGAPNTVYNLAEGLMYVLPAVIGIFWGAPLLARELEAGTHRLAWNQSVTRTRWLAAKLAIIGAAAAATTGLLSWGVTTWAHRIDSATGDRITPMVYGARGIVPIGYALFAFTLGVTAGMLIRRTVPAMAATLAGYVALAVAMPQWIRAQLVPASQTTSPLDMSELDQLGIDPEGGMRIVSGDLPEGAWVLSNQTVTPTGESFTGPTNWDYCGPDARPQACKEWVDTLGLRQDLTYQPANHFWPLQWVETGILLAAALLLTGFCFWWLRRRLS
jgi:hypothetical protein